MARYAAKVTVWLQIESDYADGVGEAQWEVEGIIGNLVMVDDKNLPCDKVRIARTTDIEILEPKLREEPGECTDKLFLGDVCLDDGVR